jgi:hypothetical protein
MGWFEKLIRSAASSHFHQSLPAVRVVSPTPPVHHFSSDQPSRARTNADIGAPHMPKSAHLLGCFKNSPAIGLQRRLDAGICFFFNAQPGVFSSELLIL